MQKDNVQEMSDGTRRITPGDGFRVLANGADEMRILPDGHIHVQYRTKWYLAVPTNWTGRGLYVKLNNDDHVVVKDWADLLSMSQKGTTYPEKGTFNPSATLPIAVVTESTFESYNFLYGKIRAMEIIESAGGIVLTFPSRNTAMTRFALDIEKIKSNKKEDLKRKDRQDAEFLYRQLMDGRLHLKRAIRPMVIMAGLSEQFEAHRRDHTLASSDFADLIAGILPPPQDTPLEFRTMWCDGDRYSLENVVPMYLAFLRSNKTRKDFEREVGTYVSGYPSFARATYYRLTMGSRQARRAAQKRNKPRPGMAAILTQSICRRELRRLFHFMSQKGTMYPEKGTINPSATQQ